MTATDRIGLICLLYFSPLCGGCEWEVEENSRSTEAIVTAPTQNYLANPTTPGQEVSVAYVPGGGNTPGRWVMGFIPLSTPVERHVGWAYSSDAMGTNWTSRGIPSGTAWGDPGPSPVSSSPFAGWRSDPSLAPVTDPTINNNGTRVLVSEIAIQANGMLENVIVALSSDRGETWANTQYVNTASSGGADHPTISSNPNSPYGTYVAWASSSSPTGGWINSVRYATPTSFTKGTPVPIPRTLPYWINVPNVAMGVVKGCDGILHQAVYVAYAGIGPPHCTPGTATTYNMKWFLAVYDTVANVFYGPWGIANDATFPTCVGGSGSMNRLWDPGVEARLAVDSASPTFFLAHVNSTAYGTRIDVDSGSIGCGGGTPAVTATRMPVCNPNTPNCVMGGLGRTDGSGMPIIQDDWAPSIAFVYGPSMTPRTVVTWMSTRDDPGNANRLTNIYMAFSEDRFWSVSSPVRVSFATPGTTQTVPWDQNIGSWIDYQGLAPNPITGAFLAGWGGDCRSNFSFCQIYSGLMQ